MEPRDKSAILVHAFDRHTDLVEFLNRFLEIRGPELIAVTGPRADFQRVVRNENHRVKLIFQDQFWKSQALKTALQHTEAEIIILTDIDCRISQSWLDRLLAPILEEGEAVVTGPSLPGPSFHPFIQYQRSNELALIARRSRYVDGIFGRNTALRRAALEKLAASVQKSEPETTIC